MSLNLSETSHLKLPLLAAGQAQKHVTHNEALLALDRSVQITVVSRDVVAPPPSPVEGARYILATTGLQGRFIGHPGEIATSDGGAWAFTSPRNGWLVWIEQEALLFAWHQGALVPVHERPVSMLGINATADATNRLSVSSEASLFNHAGTSHRLKLNKAVAGDTGSVLFQTGFSGRAEFGLTGEDDFSIKTSSDGTTWRTALRIEAATGIVSTPGTDDHQPNLVINGDFTVNQRGFAGGALAAGAFGLDRWKAGPAGATLNAATAGVTLSQGRIDQLIEPQAFGFASFAGRTMTLSLDAYSSGPILAQVGAQAITLPAGAARRHASVTVPAGHTGPLALSFSVGSGAIQIGGVALQIGATDGKAPPRRPLRDELALCRRYYTRLGAAHLTAVTAGSPAAVIRMVFPETMRVTPAISLLASQAIFVIPAYSGTFTAAPVLTSAYHQDTSCSVYYSATGFPGPTAQLTAFLADSAAFAEASAEI
jgi:Protein of unknown function (DUF2793)